MEKIEIELFKFDELSEKVKEEVIRANREINVTDDSWAYDILKEAKSVGIIIEAISPLILIVEGFATDTANLIVKSHDKNAETYLAADEYLKSGKSFCDFDTFHKKIKDGYSNILSRKSEERMSRWAIYETIRQGGYKFLSNGSVFTLPSKKTVY